MKKTILIIDDTEINIDILIGLLGDQFDILVAIDGFTGIEIACDEEKIDLILLDIMMPQINGFEVCQKLKNNKDTKDIPIIFSTAKTDEDSIAQAYDVGGVDYITKPFKTKELLAKVNTHLLLNEQKEKLENLIFQIDSSINYAQRIQKSLLRDVNTIKDNFKDSFIIYKSKDKIGGDLYIYEEFEENVLFGVIDCTGHGIPGAMMTMLVATLLQKIKVEVGFSNPAEVLKKLNIGIKYQLQQYDDITSSDVGLDAGLCSLNKDKSLLKYSGARINLVCVDDNNANIIKSNRQSVGYKRCDIGFDYKVHDIDLKSTKNFYLYSDGIVDQVGGEKKFPFGQKRFLELLNSISNKNMQLQKDIILESLKDYQRSEERRDDITIFGFKVN
jgi:CheY-like chemotaxis protein